MYIADVAIHEENEYNYEQSVFLDTLGQNNIIEDNNSAFSSPDGRSGVFSGLSSNSLGTLIKRLRFQRTIDAAVSTATILKHLSSETADAHTRLISRLLGVTADVRKLSEGLRDSISGSNSSNINDQLTSEANRLALLAEIMDNTIDADADADAVEPGLVRSGDPIGRGGGWVC